MSVEGDDLAGVPDFVIVSGFEELVFDDCGTTGTGPISGAGTGIGSFLAARIALSFSSFAAFSAAFFSA